MTANTSRPIAPSGFRPNLRTIPNPNGGGGDVAEYIQPSASKVETGFYVESRGLPWHVTLAQRLGQDPLMVASDRKLSVEEAITLAGLDWEVALAPMFARLGADANGEGGTLVPVPNRFVSYRTDTGRILGSNHSNRFKLVQNRDAFTFGDVVIDVSGAHIETAASLFGGCAVYVSFELPDEVHVAGDDSEYRLFLVVSNGHDGGHTFRADVTVERVVCRNTLRIAQNRALSSWSIRHSSGLDGRVQQARNALGLTHRYVEEFTADASKLSGSTLAERQVDAILRKLYPLTEEQQTSVEKDASKLDKTPLGKVLAIYRESPTVAPLRGTAYGLMNAVTEYEDHFRRFRSDENGTALDRRANKLMFDDKDAKAKAWKLLVAASDPRSKAKVR